MNKATQEALHYVLSQMRTELSREQTRNDQIHQEAVDSDAKLDDLRRRIGAVQADLA